MGKIKGTAKRPRLTVFRSNKAIYAQIIDDEKGKTLVAASEKNLDKKTKKPASAKASAFGRRSRLRPTKSAGKQKTKTEKARMVGEILAKKALKKKVKTIVFDRGKYRYHGRVRALAEGARSGGLKF